MNTQFPSCGESKQLGALLTLTPDQGFDSILVSTHILNLSSVLVSKAPA